jgi:putative heme-binding domain-containing protein
MRVDMIGILSDFGDLGAYKVLLGFVGSSTEPEAVQSAALGGLFHFDENEVVDTVLARYSALPAASRPRAMDLMLARPAWAARVLDAVDAGKIPPADVTVEQLRRVTDFRDKTLDTRIANRWGKVTGGTPEEKLAEVRRFNNDLRAFPGNAVAGRVIFQNTCGVCHKLYDEGATVGPDLTHANRKDRDYLLVSIVDPSAVVRAEFLSYTLKTTDGRVLSGLLVEQNAASVTLLAAKGERTNVPREKIAVLQESAVSLMPEGLLTPLKPQELRDLFAYLQSEKKP